MRVLGLNAYGHDAAAVLLCDGDVVFAASEERFDRVRHSAAFPAGAIAAALAHAGLGPRDVDRVAVPWARGMARGRKALYVARHLPRSLAFLRERPDRDLPDRRAYLRAHRGLARTLAAHGIRAPLVRVAHHRAHAASARLVLRASDALVLTADGMGEWTTTALWHATGGRLACRARAAYPHSAGKVYAALTAWLGFRPEGDEGKTMGLAAYGDPAAPAARAVRAWLRPHRRRLLRVRLDAFGYPWGEARLYGAGLLAALGPPRDPGEALRPGDADAARGLQDAVFDVARAALEAGLARTGAREVGLAGGLFLNCALNGALARALPVPVRPFPVAGDAGAAWGAAAEVSRRLGAPPAPLRTLALGRAIGAAEARAALGAGAGPAREPADLARALAARLARGQVIGVARGRAEFGPRALGRRSVLAHPVLTARRDEVNRRKGREAWRPLAPVVRRGDTRWFRPQGHPPDLDSPWMILTYEATEEARARVPGVVHADGTARVQTVAPGDDDLLPLVLDALGALGEPEVLLNTSLNRPGEPIVDRAEEALAAARAMGLDALVLGPYFVDLPPAPDPA